MGPSSRAEFWRRPRCQFTATLSSGPNAVAVKLLPPLVAPILASFARTKTPHINVGMTPTGEVRGTLMDGFGGLRKMRARLGKHMGPSADETELTAVCVTTWLSSDPTLRLSSANEKAVVQQLILERASKSGSSSIQGASRVRRYHREWRVPLPRRKSTNPPANSCGREVTLLISNCSRN
jgi:hypothetical protein